MKKTTIHTPKLAAIRFIGNFQKKLFEVGARKLPILSTGDIVIVNEIESTLLLRQPHFERVNIETLFVSENEENDEELEQNTTNTDENLVTEKIEMITDKNELEALGREHGVELDRRESIENMKDDLAESLAEKNETENTSEETAGSILPFKEDLETLTEEEIKEACIKAGIKIGRKTIDTLKATLLPHLPSKEN
jgi:predicted  nucleic acid-binding Zn-ribbon protein